MARKKGQKVTANAIARVEAVARATYQRKKTTTEIIPADVSRAKAGAWLTLLSPITEWAGLKGDALNFQRRLLRIQQEETLLRVARSVREKLAAATVTRPVPRKILVPALEKASLEDAADDTMIEQWANLLASAAQDVKVQPRFVGILEEIAGSQAKCLERIAFNRYMDFHFPAAEFEESSLNFAEYNILEDYENAMRETLGEGEINKAFDKIVRTFNSPGALLSVAFVDCPDQESSEAYDTVAETGVRDDANLSILESLGLIRYVVIRFSISQKRGDGLYQLSTHYHHLTQLGVEFCEVCSKPRLDELQKIDAALRKKGMKRALPFREKS